MKRTSQWWSRLSAAMLLAMSSVALAEPTRWQLNMPKGVTSTSAIAYELHMIFLWICVVIGIIVFGAMFYSMFKFRKSKGAKPDTSFTHSTTLEIIWTVVPVLILIYGGVVATKGLLNMVDSSGAQMTVKVTGFQWGWRYEVVDYKGKPTGVNFVSKLADDSDAARQLGSGIDVATVPNYLLEVDNALVIPTNTKVRFVFTADDVIHAWWVPDLGWKQDAIPGIINDQWTLIKSPGVFRGVCAELCGKDHGFMPIVVKAVDQPEFDSWLAANSPAAAVESTATAPIESIPSESAPVESAPTESAPAAETPATATAAATAVAATSAPSAI